MLLKADPNQAAAAAAAAVAAPAVPLPETEEPALALPMQEKVLLQVLAEVMGLGLPSWVQLPFAWRQ